MVEKRRFSDTDEMISLLGFGGLRLPWNKSKTDIDYELGNQMVDYAIAHGVNYFDTAYAYSGGKSEVFFGSSLARYPRNIYNIATKLPLSKIKSEQDIDTIFEKQLERLQVDYFDYYLLHHVNRAHWKISQKFHIFETLFEKKKKGQIRHLGFSFHDTPSLLQEVVDAHTWDFAQIQLNYMDWELQDAKTQYKILAEKKIANHRYGAGSRWGFSCSLHQSD